MVLGQPSGSQRPGGVRLVWEVESCLGDLPQVGVLAKHFTPTELARMVRAILS